MGPRVRRYPFVTSKEVAALLTKADRLFAEAAKARKRARTSLANYFKQEAADLPTADDCARRERMVRRQKKR